MAVILKCLQDFIYYVHQKTGSHTYEMFPKCAIHPCLLENNHNFTNKLEIHDINTVKSKLSPILKSSMLLSPKVRSSLLLSSIKHVILWPYHGIKWNNHYYYYTRLVFASRSSPKIFDSLSVAICWIAMNILGIPVMFHLLDDFLTIDAPEVLAEQTMSLISLLFNQLNIHLATHKTVYLNTCLEYLGIVFDTKNMEARLPEDKVSRICEILNSFKNKKSCTKRQLLCWVI